MPSLSMTFSYFEGHLSCLIPFETL